MIRRRTLDTLDVPLGPGCQTLRVGLYRDEAGEPLDMTMALGWGDGRTWREKSASGLTLPASALPALRDALATLCEEEDP